MTTVKISSNNENKYNNVLVYTFKRIWEAFVTMTRELTPLELTGVILGMHVTLKVYTLL